MHHPQLVEAEGRSDFPCPHACISRIKVCRPKSVPRNRRNTLANRRYEPATERGCGNSTGGEGLVTTPIVGAVPAADKNAFAASVAGG